MNILFITPYLPSKKADHAGGIVVAKSIEYLSKFHNIYLLSFIRNAYESSIIDSIERYCKSIFVYKINNFQKIYRSILHFYLPNLFAIRLSLPILFKLIFIVRKFDIMNIQIEYTQMGIYGLLLRLIFPRVNIIYVEHDITRIVYQRKFDFSKHPFKLYYWFELNKIIFWEGLCLRKFNIILTLNNKDKLYLQKVFGLQNVYSIVPYYGIDKIVDDYHLVKDPYICFVGSMNRSENEDAAIILIKDILPRIREKIKNVKLFIIGSSPTSNLLSLSSDDVIITGFVDNIIERMSLCRIAIYPLRFGGGIKIKILQSLAIGMPVITTEVGNEGIDENGICVIVANNYETMINNAIDLLIDDEKYINLRNRSIQFMKQNFSFSVTETVLDNLYNK